MLADIDLKVGDLVSVGAEPVSYWRVAPDGHDRMKLVPCSRKEALQELADHETLKRVAVRCAELVGAR